MPSSILKTMQKQGVSAALETAELSPGQPAQQADELWGRSVPVADLEALAARQSLDEDLSEDYFWLLRGKE